MRYRSHRIAPGAHPEPRLVLMPWHIETANPDCRSGYAVVKDDDGSVEGCHRTRREALAQLAALNIAEAERAAAAVEEERQELSLIHI